MEKSFLCYAAFRYIRGLTLLYRFSVHTEREMCKLALNNHYETILFDLAF